MWNSLQGQDYVASAELHSLGLVMLQSNKSVHMCVFYSTYICVCICVCVLCVNTYSGMFIVCVCL